MESRVCQAWLVSGWSLVSHWLVMGAARPFRAAFPGILECASAGLTTHRMSEPAHRRTLLAVIPAAGHPVIPLCGGPPRCLGGIFIALRRRVVRGLGILMLLFGVGFRWSGIRFDRRRTAVTAVTGCGIVIYANPTPADQLTVVGVRKRKCAN